MSRSLQAIIGGAGGVLAVLAIAIGFLWFCKSHSQRSSNKNSDTGSSDPSAVVEMKRGSGGSRSSARQFSMEELEQATKQFDESNLIGYGSFGVVYKGFLCDGTFVAIKKRPGLPRHELVEEVNHLAGLRHRNLVNLLGYCQECGSQMLVYEHLPNGSMCNHLYADTAKESTSKLEFKQRVSIALGAAKGLSHLHSLRPPMVHGNFKTANVLVDENFIAKVADGGLCRLLQRIEDAGPSHHSTTLLHVFQDPEVVGESRIMNEGSDVYSFGVYLMELVTGQEAALHIDYFRSYQTLLQWVETQLSKNELVDKRLVGSFTEEGMRDMIRLTLECMSQGQRRRDRPSMDVVVSELDRILDKEITLTTVMGEGTTTTVTLGSQLFTQT